MTQVSHAPLLRKLALVVLVMFGFVYVCKNWLIFIS
jgi:hypothetical protein